MKPGEIKGGSLRDVLTSRITQLATTLASGAGLASAVGSLTGNLGSAMWSGAAGGAVAYLVMTLIRAAVRQNRVPADVGRTAIANIEREFPMMDNPMRVRVQPSEHIAVEMPGGEIALGVRGRGRRKLISNTKSETMEGGRMILSRLAAENPALARAFKGMTGGIKTVSLSESDKLKHDTTKTIAEALSEGFDLDDIKTVLSRDRRFTAADVSEMINDAKKMEIDDDAATVVGESTEEGYSALLGAVLAKTHDKRVELKTIKKIVDRFDDDVKEEYVEELDNELERRGIKVVDRRISAKEQEELNKRYGWGMTGRGPILSKTKKTARVAPEPAVPEDPTISESKLNTEALERSKLNTEALERLESKLNTEALERLDVFKRGPPHTVTDTSAGAPTLDEYEKAELELATKVKAYKFQISEAEKKYNQILNNLRKEKNTKIKKGLIEDLEEWADLRDDLQDELKHRETALKNLQEQRPPPAESEMSVGPYMTSPSPKMTPIMVTPPRPHRASKTRRVSTIEAI
jgi:hypothetical protein